MTSPTREIMSRVLRYWTPRLASTHTIHPADGHTTDVTVTWLYRSLTVSYHTSRYPRWVRRARAQERARLTAVTAAALARLDQPGGATR